MIIEFLAPILEWVGIGLVPFLILLLILVLAIKG